MNKSKFKTRFLHLLEQEVTGLSSDKKLKYMKKWIRDFEHSIGDPSKPINAKEPIKIGLLVRTTLSRIVNDNLLSAEQVKQLQDERYCKDTFNLNFPFLKKVLRHLPLSEQRKINGNDRYWAKEIVINNEKYLLCNDWHDKNKAQFSKWVKELDN